MASKMEMIELSNESSEPHPAQPIPMDAGEPIVSLHENQPEYLHQFIEPFDGLIESDLKTGVRMNFAIRTNDSREKISPILQLARPEDARIITELVKEAYRGTYPYKEMEDVEEVKKRLASGTLKFVLFKDEEGTVMGATGFGIDVDQKKGYLRTLVVKKKYLGKLDAKKAYMGSCIAMWNAYKDDILIWWGEARTADAKSQHINRSCSVRPIAFYPNKDVFYDEIESDLMMISYDTRALREHGRKEVPRIIKEVLECFRYSHDKYGLTWCELAFPELNLDPKKLSRIHDQIQMTIKEDDFGYQTICFFIPDSDSYFEFVYTPNVKNFEKTTYHVKNVEELFLFVQSFKQCAEEVGVRYFEAYVSAYQPEHQQAFLEAGLVPRGYIPSWKYHPESDDFEDHVLFNHFEGELAEGLQLIPEGEKLLEQLNMRK